jgi:hypothetical protein
MSQVGLDFWTLKEEKTGRAFDLIRQGFKHERLNPRTYVARNMTAPGPDGAEPCLSYEMLREGMQAAEAFSQVGAPGRRLPVEVRLNALDTAQAFDAIIGGRYMLASKIARNQGRWNTAVRDLYRVAGELQANVLGKATVSEKPLTASSIELLPLDIDNSFWPRSADEGLRLVVPRDGYASALSVVRGVKVAGVTVTPPRLTGPGGVIVPADAVQMRWLKADKTFTPTPVVEERNDGKTILGKQQYILLTIRAPRNAATGVYTGHLQVKCEGFDGSLPIQLEIMPWILPAPKDWRMLNGMIHSPESVAKAYKVEPWSDAHLKYMEPTLNLLRDLGGETCIVYLICGGYMQERYSMVRRGADGTPDYTYMDRYLDLWQRICGQPKIITLYVWDQNHVTDNWSVNAGVTQMAHGPAHYSASNSVKVTRIKTDGTMENMMAPYYGTPSAKAFWQPVFDGIRARLSKRGWQNTEVLLGMPLDQLPQEEVVTFLKEVAPQWRWRQHTHAYSLPLPNAEGKIIYGFNGMELGWLELVEPMVSSGTWTGGTIRRAMEKKHTNHTTLGHRLALGLGNPGSSWRFAPTISVIDGLEGVSQVGMDYAGQINSGNTGANPRHGLAQTITVFGSNGAEPRLHYEWLREGMQVAEAFQQVRDHDSNVPAEIKVKAGDAAQTFELFIQTRQGWNDQAVQNQNRWNAAVRDLYKVAGVVQAAKPKGATKP